jgi:phosphoserine phosphatase RsbU/P
MNENRLRRICGELAELIDQRESVPAAHAGDADDEIAMLASLVERIRAQAKEREKIIVDRTLQLELLLGILRSRDKAAAEQAEWDFATDLQLSGLPQDFPAFPDRNEFDLHAGMVTAKEVGGDLYDFFLLAPNRLGFVIADAAGKGLPAAIFITLTRTILRAAAERMADPGECLGVVNAILCLDNPTLMFSTAFYGVLDIRTGEISYASAGHNPPYLLRRSGNVEALHGSGAMALGVVEDMQYSTRQARLAPGETLVCFTDGVTEATDGADVLFSETRLERFLTGQVGRHPTEVLGAVIAEVDAYMALAPMADDVTLLVLRYNGNGAKVG